MATPQTGTLLRHIERLAALVGSGAGTSQVRSPVPIRSGGARRPLFLVHPVGGDVLCYASLARQLAPGRPLAGLPAPGLDGRSAPLRRLEELAAHHLDRMVEAGHHDRSTLLGGWSMGGVVAFEMARQLRLRGMGEVPLLLLLDSFAPGGMAAVDDAELLQRFAADWGLTAGVDLGIAASDLRGLDPRAGVRHLIAAARAAGLASAGHDVAQVTARFDVFRACTEAVAAYRPVDVYPGRLLLLRSAGGHGDASRGWEPWAAEVEVRTVPGDHYSILRDPDVRGLSSELDDVLSDYE